MLASALLPTRLSRVLTTLRPFRRATFFQPLSPMRLPLRSGLTPPASPSRRGCSVVLHRNGEDRPRNEFGCDECPWPVVPATDVPAAIGEHVVVGPVEEVVCSDARSVHNGRTRNPRQRRGRRKIDPDVHADLSVAQARATKECKECQAINQCSSSHQ